MLSAPAARRPQLCVASVGTWPLRGFGRCWKLPGSEGTRDEGENVWLLPRLRPQAYKVAAEELEVGGLGDAIATRIAVRDC